MKLSGLASEVGEPTLIKGMHARFTLPCNDIPQISQLIKLGIVGQRTAREQQKGLTKTNTHSEAIHTHTTKQIATEAANRTTLNLARDLQKYVQIHTDWDEPTENIIYLENVANIFKGKNPLKNLSEEKL